MDPDAFNNLMKSMLSSTPVVEPIDTLMQQAAVKAAAAAATSAASQPAAAATAPALNLSLDAAPSSMRMAIPKPVSKEPLSSPVAASAQRPSTPSAHVNLRALQVVAPAGMEARTTVRIRRDRARSAAADSQPRSMFVTRVQSLLRALPEDEDADEQDEEDEVDEPAQMIEEGEVVTPRPAAAAKSKSGGRAVVHNPAALSSASPYPFGAPSPPPPSRPAAVSPIARRRSTAYQEESDDDESKSASTPSVAAAASGRPRSQRNPAPKRRHDEVDIDDVHEEQGGYGDDDQGGADEEQGDRDEEEEGAMGDDNSSAAGGSFENDPARCLRFNTSSRIRAMSATHLNRSGCRSWNAFLKDIDYRTHDLHELTSEEFLTLVPRWAVEARMSNGDLYVHCTIKGYMNSLLRVVRCFQPKSEWAHLPSLAGLPGMAQAIVELQARELALHKKKNGGAERAKPQASSGAIVSTSSEMTTRRAQRIANGEPAHRESYYSYSQSSSADNSPHHQSFGSGADLDPGFSLEPGPAVMPTSLGQGRRTPLLKFTPEQEAYLMSALDPGQPEGLQRLNFISIARYFGITYTEENRSLTIRNFLRGSKVVKVRYQGGLKPRPEATEAAANGTDANNAGTTNGISAEAAPAVVAAAAEPAVAAEPAAAESAMSDAVASEAASAPAAADVASAAAPSSAAAAVATPAVAPDLMDTSDLASAPAAPSVAAAEPTAAPAMNGEAAAAAAVPVADAAAAAASADSAVPAASADSASAVYADENTPFELADPADDSPSVCLRLVRFIVFIPSPGSKRRMGFIYERPWDGDLCPIRLYDSYLSHRPPVLSGVASGASPQDVDASYTLWLKSKKHLAPFEFEWFLCQPIGRGKLSNIIPMVCQGLQYAPGFSNSSILHTPYRRNVSLTDAEIEDIKTENRRCNYGVPTAAENRAAQQAAQQAAAEAAAANQQSKQEAELAPALPPPSGRQNKRQRLEANNAAAAPVQQQPVDPSSVYQQQLQQRQQPHQQPASSYQPRSYSAQPPRNFYPGPSGFIPEYLQRNDRLLQYIDHANEAGAKFNVESPPDVAPLLLASGTAPSSFPVTLGSVSAIPPSFPSAPAMPPLLSRSSLVPSRVDSVPQLMSFLDRFEGELSTLQSMAAAAAQSLSGLRSLAQGLRAEASASVKVQQQTAKIAEQFKIIEEQKFLIEQLKAAAAGGAAATVAASVAPAPAVTASPLTAASTADAFAPTAAIPPTEEKRAEDGPVPMDEDERADELPPLVAETIAAAATEEQKQSEQQPAADAGKPALLDSNPSGSSSRSADQNPSLLV